MAQNKYIDELYRKVRNVNNNLIYSQKDGSISTTTSSYYIGSLKYSSSSFATISPSSRQSYKFETSTATNSSLIFNGNGFSGYMDVSDFKSKIQQYPIYTEQKFYVNLSFVSNSGRTSLTEMVACASTSAEYINEYISWNDCHAAIGVFEDAKDADKSVFKPASDIIGDLQLHLWPQSEEKRGLIFGGHDASGDFAKTSDMLKITKGYNINAIQDPESWKGFVKIYLRENHQDYKLGQLVQFADLTTDYIISGTQLASPDSQIIYNISDNYAYQNDTTHKFADNTRYKQHTTTNVLECNRSILQPTSVDTIEASAFLHNDGSNDNCELITKISFPRYTKAIGEYAFKNCKKLKYIQYHEPSSNNEIPKKAGDGLPPEITRIEKETFYSCTSLNDLTISSNINYIGSSAFKECKNTSFTFNDGYKALEIDSMAFSEIGQNNLILPNNITKIGSYAFSTNSNLSSVTIPYGTKGKITLGQKAFQDCSNLSTVSFGLSNNETNVQVISKQCFAGCKKLKYINKSNNISANIPEGIQTIEDYAFNPYPGSTQQSSEMFKSISLPSTLRHTGSNIFTKNTALESIIWNPKWCGKIGSDNYSSNSEAPFYSLQTQIKSVTFGEQVEVIPNYLCYGMKNSNFTSVTIPASVRQIGKYAFQSTDKLSSLTINSNGNNSPQLSILECAFRDSSKLTGVTIPIRCVKIDSSAFANNLSLSTLNFNGASTYKSPTLFISTQAFYHAKSLSSISIPARCSYIGSFAFFPYDDGYVTYPSITTLNIFPKDTPYSNDDVLLTIEESAFRNNSSINNNVIIPDRTTTINQFAFRYCDHIPKIQLGSCDESTVSYNDNITSQHKNVKLTTIGDNAFEHCSNITNINIPYNVDYIDSSIFANCSKLTTINWRAKNATVTLSSYRGQKDGDGEYITVNNEYVNYYANSSINTINFMDGVDIIPSRAICSNLKLAIDVFRPGGNVSYDTKFADYHYIKNINIAKSVYEIKHHAFWFNTEGTDSMGIEHGLSNWILFGNPKTSFVTLNNGLRIIGYNAFECCYGMSINRENTITIPHTVSTIRDDAFYRVVAYEEIKTIRLGCGLTYIGSGAFNSPDVIPSYSLSKVEQVYFYSLIPPDMGMGGTFGTVGPFYDVLTKGPAYPYALEYDDCIDWYKSAPGTGSGTREIELEDASTSNFNFTAKVYYDFNSNSNNRVIIATGSFTNNDFVNDSSSYNFSGELTIPSTVTVNGQSCTVVGIADEAFRFCAITKVTIPYTVEFIGPRAFYGCSSLKQIVFEENSNLRVIDEFAFYSTMLQNIALPDSVQVIGQFAFANIILNQVDVSIGERCKRIHESAFYNTCVNAFNVNSNNETYCSIDASYGYGGLYSKDQTILYYAIPLTNLTNSEFTIVNSTKEISNYAFDNIFPINKLTINASNLYIYGFNGLNSNLSSIIPYNNVLEIIVNCEKFNIIFYNDADYILYERKFRKNKDAFEIIKHKTSETYKSACNFVTKITFNTSVKEIGANTCNYMTNATFEYKGTVNEWKKVTRNYEWHEGCSETQITCKDDSTSLDEV